MEESQKSRIYEWLTYAAIILVLATIGVFWLENRGVDILGIQKAPNTLACQSFGVNGTDASLVAMSHLAQGSLKQHIDGWLEFKKSETYSANSLQKANDDLAAVVDICQGLLADVQIKK